MTPSRIIGGYVLSLIVCIGLVAVGMNKGEDQLAFLLGKLVVGLLYFASLMVVVVTPVVWLFGAEDRWKWLRQTEERKAARFAPTSQYASSCDVAEPSVRGSVDDDEDGDADGDGDG